jgi:mono/diheme cytochrome c family protein
MTYLPTPILLLITLATLGATVNAQMVPQDPIQAPFIAKPEESRGALLYTSHCITCHTTQIHWRLDKLATDWDSLKFQVSRWQSNTGLLWSDADITAVAQYLNKTIYQYPEISNHAGRLPPFNPPQKMTSVHPSKTRHD